MLVGYVSNEQFLALADALVDFHRRGEHVATVRSTARGAVYADIEPGDYVVTLACPGHGSKSVPVSLRDGEPFHFRMLSDRMRGYMWPKWNRSGELSEFRVHAVEPYRLSLWRYGKEKEFVRLLGWFDEHGPRANMQITPDGDYTPTGIAWNRRGYGHSHLGQRVAAPQRSGLYYLHAKGESGAFTSFPWVVAPAAPTCPVAVLANSITWNAYNNFGGRSNYINARALPAAPVVNARLDLPRYAGSDAFTEWGADDHEYTPLSFDRPEEGNVVPEHVQAIDPIEGRVACGLAPAEWRMLAWLEREGFPYDYYSDCHLHDGTLNLDAYRVLVLGVHPEYWSKAMFQRVKEWVARGGRLMYLGGNGLNCEVDFIDGHAMRCRTMLRAVNGALGMHDPKNPDIYYDSRMHRTGESEAGLLGVVTTETGIMTAAPYRVIDASHWVFDGTGLKNGDLFGERSQHERCHGGASGHETDKMSPNSPKETVLLAKGFNPDNGGAEIVVVAPPGGGRVYSVGSINYVASLLVDPTISRITRNVLEAFVSGSQR